VGPSSPNCGYRWDFDGNGSIDQVTNTASTSHTYSSPGGYQPKLIIFDADGDTADTTRSVTVADRPDLTIAKSHAGNFVAGQQGTYTLAVSNHGGGPTTGTTTVTDTLPAGLSFASATGSGWSCGAASGTVTCTRSATIAANSAAPPITLTTNVADSARPAVTNTASVATPVETATGDNSDSDPTTVDSVDVGIEKTHNGTFRVNRTETYSLRVRNDGTLPTTGATTVSDELPAGMTYWPSTPPAGWTCGSELGVVTCAHPASLPVGYDETIDLQVAVGDAALPARTNTATIATAGDTDPSDDSSSDPTVVVAQPDLAIDKSHAASFRVGSPGEYELSVRNDGALPTDGTTTVTDTVPAGLPVVSASGAGWACDVAGQDVTCESDAVLAPDESAPDITIVTGVTEAAMPSVTNTAHVATSGTGSSSDPNPANDSDSDHTNVTAVNLAIAKDHVGSSFPIGGAGTYTLSVRNDGTAATTGATTVTDSLPADLGYVSATGSGWSCGAVERNVTCTRNASIPAGTAAPAITLQVAVGNTVADDVTNEAAVATAGDIVPGDDSDSDVATLTAADLEIDKSHTGDFRAGTTRAYALKVRNVGTLPTSGTTTVTDQLPAGLSYVGASGPGWSCGAAGQDVSCTRSTAIPGGGPASTIQLEVAVDAAASPGVTNSATVANALDRNPSNDSDSDPTTIHAPDLAIDKSHQGDLRTSGTAAYDIDVENVGDAPTDAATTVTDELPAGLSYAGFSGGEWSCGAAAQLVTCTHPGAIAAGGHAGPLTIAAHVTAAADTEITNTAGADFADDASAANDSDDDTAGVGRVDVTIDKSHAGDLPRDGQASYRIDVANEGSLPTVGPVVVTDELPDGLRFASASGGGWSCGFAAGTITCERSAPLGGSSAADPITIEVVVDKHAPDAIVNTATVATRDDADSANDTDADPGTVTARAPDAALAMRPRGDLRAGGSGTWGLAVRNVGSAPTSGGVTATLSLPGGVSYVGGSGDGWSCSAAGAVVTCTHASSLAADSRSDVGVDVAVADNAALGIFNGSVATAGDPNPGNNSGTQLAGFKKVDAAVTLSHRGDFTAGEAGSLQVGVRNAGSAATLGTTAVTVELPGSLRFVSGGGGGWACGPASAGAICERAVAIQPGASSPFEVQVRPTADAVPRATAVATVATEEDAVAANDRASDAVPVAAAAPDVKLAGGKLAVSRGKVAIEVSCLPSGGRCESKLALGRKAGASEYGSATLRLDAGTSAAVAVKLSRKAKKALAKKGKLKAVASAGGASAKVKLAGAKRR
jgi:uncharacterized repeat protein (TIGR01451 family)